MAATVEHAYPPQLQTQSTPTDYLAGTVHLRGRVAYGPVCGAGLASEAAGREGKGYLASIRARHRSAVHHADELHWARAGARYFFARQGTRHTVRATNRVRRTHTCTLRKAEYTRVQQYCPLHKWGGVCTSVWLGSLQRPAFGVHWAGFEVVTPPAIRKISVLPPQFPYLARKHSASSGGTAAANAVCRQLTVRW